MSDKFDFRKYAPMPALPPDNDATAAPGVGPDADSLAQKAAAAVQQQGQKYVDATAAWSQKMIAGLTTAWDSVVTANQAATDKMVAQLGRLEEQWKASETRITAIVEQETAKRAAAQSKTTAATEHGRGTGGEKEPAKSKLREWGEEGVKHLIEKGLEKGAEKTFELWKTGELKTAMNTLKGPVLEAAARFALLGGKIGAVVLAGIALEDVLKRVARAMGLTGNHAESFAQASLSLFHSWREAHRVAEKTQAIEKNHGQLQEVQASTDERDRQIAEDHEQQLEDERNEAYHKSWQEGEKFDRKQLKESEAQLRRARGNEQYGKTHEQRRAVHRETTNEWLQSAITFSERVAAIDTQDEERANERLKSARDHLKALEDPASGERANGKALAEARANVTKAQEEFDAAKAKKRESWEVHYAHKRELSKRQKKVNVPSAHELLPEPPKPPEPKDWMRIYRTLRDPKRPHLARTSDELEFLGRPKEFQEQIQQQFEDEVEQKRLEKAAKDEKRRRRNKEVPGLSAPQAMWKQSAGHGPEGTNVRPIEADRIRPSSWHESLESHQVALDRSGTAVVTAIETTLVAAVVKNNQRILEAINRAVARLSSGQIA